MLKLNIKNPRKFRAHRSGWGFVIDRLSKFHSSKGIIFDDFLDITFGYSQIINEENRTIPYTKPWIGVLHHPPNICPWYSEKYKNSIDIHNFIRSTSFQISLEKCEGIIVLSEYLKDYLINNFSEFKKIPIIAIKHPTEQGELFWDFQKFKKASSLYGLKILSVGYFLRNMTSIYLIKSNRKLDKYLMPSDLRYGLSNLSLEFKHKQLTHIDKNSIKILNWQDNKFYDKLLEQSILFLDMYDTSCNNAIIESIVRHTPIIINRHPAIEEYIGQDYPLFYDSLDRVPNLINYDTIYEASKYLKSNNYDYLGGEYFTQNFELLVQTELLHHSADKLKRVNNSKKVEAIVTQPTMFNHRHGWSAISTKLSEKYPYVYTPNSLYLNNFLENTFKYDKIGGVKSLLIEDKKYTVTRGYNLFSANSTDVVQINNKYYEWRESKWVEIKSKKIKLLCDCNSIINYKRNQWAGILHNPVNMPYWFDYSQNIHSLLSNPHMVDCLENCKVLFTLSKNLKDQLTPIINKYNSSVKIKNLYHPVPQTDKKFDITKFLKQPKLIQIGYWLRKMYSIWNVKTSLKKMWLYGDGFAADMFEQERIFEAEHNKVINITEHNRIKDIIKGGVSETINHVNVCRLNNKDYDNHLSSSVVFLNLYSASANNAVVDCMSTSTPILINKLDSIVEYLGDEYPLYYSTLDEASDLVNNIDKIKLAHEYLLGLNNTNLFTIDSFLSNLHKEIVTYAKNN